MKVTSTQSNCAAQHVLLPWPPMNSEHELERKVKKHKWVLKRDTLHAHIKFRM